MKTLDLREPRFGAPFNFVAAMRWAYSAPPRENVPRMLVWKAQLSVADIAKLAKTSVAKIKKLLLIAPNGIAAVQNIEWDRRGRPLKRERSRATEKHIRLQTKRENLQKQIGMTLAARAQQFEQRTGAKMTTRMLSAIYKGRAIHALKLRAPKGAGTTMDILTQRRTLAALKNDVRQYINQGYEVI